MGKNKNIRKQQNKKRKNAKQNQDQSVLYDPMGSYTGRPKDKNDTPEQDADDL